MTQEQIHPLSRKKMVLLFVVTFAVHLFLVWWLFLQYNCLSSNKSTNYLAVEGYDAFTYTGAMENYIIEGQYYADHGASVALAGRLPHYSVPYFLFRQFVSVRLAKDLMIVLHVFLLSLSTIFFSLLVHHVLKMKYAFWLSYLLQMLLLKLPFSALSLTPESLSISLVSLFMYTYWRYKMDCTPLRTLIMGFVLACLVLIKPQFGLLFVAVGAELLWRFRAILRTKAGIVFIARVVLLISLPFVVLLSPWIVRNYQVMGKFVPLQEDAFAGYPFAKSYMAMRHFVQCWGSTDDSWEKYQAGCYFMDNPKCQYEFPQEAFASTYNMDSLELLKRDFLTVIQNINSQSDSLVASKFDKYRMDFIAENPLEYHVLSRVRLISDFVLPYKSGPYLPFDIYSACYKPFHLLIFWAEGLLYWGLLLAGLLGTLLLLYMRPNDFIYYSMPIFLILLFPIVLKAAQHRYFIQAYPSLVLGSTMIICWCLGKIKNRISSNSLSEK